MKTGTEPVPIQAQEKEQKTSGPAESSHEE